MFGDTTHKWIRLSSCERKVQKMRKQSCVMCLVTMSILCNLLCSSIFINRMVVYMNCMRMIQIEFCLTFPTHIYFLDIFHIFFCLRFRFFYIVKSMKKPEKKTICRDEVLYLILEELLLNDQQKLNSVKFN